MTSEAPSNSVNLLRMCCSFFFTEVGAIRAPNLGSSPNRMSSPSTLKEETMGPTSLFQKSQFVCGRREEEEGGKKEGKLIIIFLLLLSQIQPSGTLLHRDLLPAPSQVSHFSSEICSGSDLFPKEGQHGWPPVVGSSCPAPDVADRRFPAKHLQSLRRQRRARGNAWAERKTGPKRRPGHPRFGDTQQRYPWPERRTGGARLGRRTRGPRIPGSGRAPGALRGIGRPRPERPSGEHPGPAQDGLLGVPQEPVSGLVAQNRSFRPQHHQPG